MLYWLYQWTWHKFEFEFALVAAYHGYIFWANMNEHTLLNDVMATMSNTTIRNTTNISLSNWHKARKQEWQLKTTQVGRLVLHIHKANLSTNIWVLGNCIDSMREICNVYHCDMIAYVNGNIGQVFSDTWWCVWCHRLD